MDTPSGPQRVNQISLARFEQWALPRMASRLPAWVLPDHLTGLAILAAVLIAGGYLLTAHHLGWLWLASAGFVLHWFGDSLDGTLARFRGIERPRYGMFVDHLADAVALLIIFLGLGLSPLMPLSVALLILVGYYLMMIQVALVALARGVFKISFGRTGPTEARLAIIAVNTIVLISGNPMIEIGPLTGTLFAIFGVAGAACLVSYFAVFAFVELRRLAKLDPSPARGGAADAAGRQAETEDQGTDRTSASGESS